MVRIEIVTINGLRHYELYVRDVFYGLYVSRASALTASTGWERVFAGVSKARATNTRAA